MDWIKLPSWRQKIIAGFILLWPEIQALTFLYIIASMVMIFTLKLPIIIALISNVPFYILLIQLSMLSVGLYEFTQKYNFKYPKLSPLKIILSFLPYQTLLGVSAVRAIYREIKNISGWEKTKHLNAHRRLFVLSRGQSPE